MSCTGLRSGALSRDYPESIFYMYPGSLNGEANYLPKLEPKIACTGLGSGALSWDYPESVFYSYLSMVTDATNYLTDERQIIL